MQAYLAASCADEVLLVAVELRLRTLELVKPRLDAVDALLVTSASLGGLERLRVRLSGRRLVSRAARALWRDRLDHLAAAVPGFSTS